ncbi:3-oxo-5-alpha-steroid 4-dehydrogenase 1 isoform X1 [Canis lupus familiaris]|uniref:3-oxo-5-alpha-steroid 4-dehydrogenase 1 isoform X1 n=1 Tax=Canis lupus familiaris TaxID=9615 RepID=UPI0003AE68E8|nr:3-oxo-5-alpha-steroid 4-dehydrogenase 1 isoform X1 [Canis lupus familiaris]
MEPAEVSRLHALAYLQCALGFLGSLLLRQAASSYGRYASPGAAFGVPARAAWALQELPSLAVPLWVCARTAAERLRRAPNRILLAMFLLHYAQRSLIFPFLIRGGKPMPLYTCVLAFTFCVYNGYLQSRYLSQYAVYADDWVTDPRFLVGGLFEYVTAANYFGEVVEWCGYGLASWSIQGGAFALFTFCILLTRAQQHHRWYLEKFEDYPKFRKIIIPFLF